MPGFSSDPFFFTPYEPTKSDDEAQPDRSSDASPKAESPRARRRPAKVIPALLGGKKS